MELLLEQALSLRAALARPVWDLDPFAAFVVLAAAFAAHGRAVGAGVKFARSIGSLALVVLVWAIAAAPGAILALGWAIARVQKFPPGAATPTTLDDLERAAVRQKWVMYAGGIVLVGWLIWPLIPALTGFLCAFLALAWWYGQENADAIHEGRPIGKQNVVVELGQGAAMGVAVWFGALLFSPSLAEAATLSGASSDPGGLMLTVPQLFQFYAPLAGLLAVVFWLGVLSQRVKTAEDRIQKMEAAEGEGGVIERMVRLEVNSENILKHQEAQTREMAGVQRQLANILSRSPKPFEMGGD